MHSRVPGCVRQAEASLTSATVLVQPDPDRPHFLDRDASAYGIGVVSSQEHDRDERVVPLACRSLSKSERYYCATSRELLAAVNFVGHHCTTCTAQHFRYEQTTLRSSD